MIARFESSGAATVATVRPTILSSRRRRSRSLVARSDCLRGAEELLDRRHLAAVDGDDEVAARERLRRRDVDRDRLHEHATGRRLDVEAPRLERDGGGDLLGSLHLGARLDDALGEGLARRRHGLRGHERRSVRPGEGQQPLDPPDLSHRDVDVVDAARPLRCVLSLHRDLPGDRVCAVRDEEVVVRGKRRQEEDHGRQERRAGQRQPAGGRRFHSRPRVSPPSTGITAPVT